MRRHAPIAAMLAALVLAAPASAQPHPEPAHPEPPRAGAPEQPRPAVPPPLPGATTRHTLELPGRTLHFTAIAGSIRLTDAQDQPQADVGVIAYVLDGADPATRPVTFAINGGPGAGSVWLQLGALGPWRLALDGITPSTPPVTMPNADTWLDFTDLVFLDPPGTGFGRILVPGEQARKRFWSVGGDLDALAETIRRWLQQNNRLASPKAIAGESYGGFRAPRLARMLPGEQGVAVSALVLISPALDLAGIGPSDDVVVSAGRLPSMAAANNGATDRAALADVEAYARGEYVTDLLRGPGDAAAIERLSARVSALTGLDVALVRQLGGAISTRTFIHEHARAAHGVASAYDATVTDPDPFPESATSHPPDPLLDGLQAPLGSAITDLYARTLDWHPPGRYEVMNAQVAHAWDWGSNRPEALRALRVDLGFDPKLRVAIVHGLTDLVTPYFTTQLLLDRMPRIGPPGRVTLVTLPGGHMVYINDASRAALRAAAERVIAPQ
jgi:carboxypeptidase C (cathepsin A)